MPKQFDVTVKKVETRTYEQVIRVTAEDVDDAALTVTEGMDMPENWKETTDERGNGTKIEVDFVEEVEDAQA